MIGVDERELQPETIEALRRGHIDAARRRVRNSAMLMLAGVAGVAVNALALRDRVQSPLMLLLRSYWLVLLAVAGGVAMVAALRDRRRIEAAAAEGAPLASPQYDESRSAAKPETHWLYRWAAILGLVLLAPATYFSCRSVTPASTVPIVFRYATIVSGTGYETRPVDILIEQNGITAVRASGGPALTAPDRAPEFDASGNYVVAAVFDKHEPDPMKALRHVWLGQIEPGASGDVVVLSMSPNRLRPGALPDPSLIVAAVAGGRYYTGSELRALLPVSR